MVQSEAPDLLIWQKWQEWYDFALVDVQQLAHERHVWVNVRSMLEGLPIEMSVGTIAGWMVRNLSRSVAIGIRRQCEERGPRPTIGYLLSAMRDQPDIASRSRFVESAEDADVARRAWLRFSPADTQAVDPDLIEGDIARLRIARTTVEPWVNERVAHLHLNLDSDELHLTLAMIWRCLDAVTEVTRRYHGLFHPTVHLWQVTPAPPLGWLQAFKVPWADGLFSEIDSAEMP